jgi:hypothetical protein
MATPATIKKRQKPKGFNFPNPATNTPENYSYDGKMTLR